MKKKLCSCWILKLCALRSCMLLLSSVLMDYWWDGSGAFGGALFSALCDMRAWFFCPPVKPAEQKQNLFKRRNVRTCVSQVR